MSLSSLDSDSVSDSQVTAQWLCDIRKWPDFLTFGFLIYKIEIIMVSTSEGYFEEMR